MVRIHEGRAPVPNAPAPQANSRNEAVLEIMKSRIRTFNPFRRSRIPEWNINIAYYCGFQNILFDGHLYIDPSKKGPFNTIVNKIFPAVRNDIAMGTKVPPKFDVVPDTTDENDRKTAMAGEKMSGYLRRINDFDKQRGKLIMWYDIANISWRKQWWDAEYKVTSVNPEEGEEGHDPNMPAGQPIYEGEALSEFTPTNELIWDWRLNTERLPWIIHAKPMTKAELLIRYPETAQNIPVGEFMEPNSTLNEFEIRVFNEFSQLSTNAGGKPIPDVSEMSENDKEIMVYEMWQIRDRNWPMGVFSVAAGTPDKLYALQNIPYPIEQYPHGEVPFTAYDMLTPDKSVSGTASRISQARPLQRELNFIRTLILENTASLGNGIMYVNRDANVTLKRIDNGTGLIIEYDGARPPVREQGQPVAGQLFLYAATIVEDINDIFSFPNVSQGKRPVGGPKSGVGIALLQEKADTQHSPIINEMDRRDERAMNQLLSIAFANYGKRMFNIVGKDNEWTLFEFDPTSYTTKFNVVVRTGSSLPISKALERDMTLGLLNTGLLGNPQDPMIQKKVLEHLDIGGLDRILKQDNRHVNWAKREFATVIQQYRQMQEEGFRPEQLQDVPKGKLDEILAELFFFPQINSFDRHDIHIIEHTNDLLDKFWEYRGSEKGDLVTMGISNWMQFHTEMHSQIYAEQQLQNAIMTGQIKREDLESSREKEEAKPKPTSTKKE